MFFRFLFRALIYRKQRLVLAFAALTVAAMLATVLFGIYGTVENRLRDEFKSYGANLIAVPSQGNTVPLALANAAERAGADASPFLITATKLNGSELAIAGFLPSKASALTSYWHVQGTRALGPNDCLAGETIAQSLHLAIGAQLDLDKFPCTLRGIVSTGAAEDRELLVPFAAAARIAGIDGQASVIELRAPADRLDAIRTQLAKEFPSADIRTVRSVAGTETERRVQDSSGAVSADRRHPADHNAVRQQQLQRVGDRTFQRDRHPESTGRGRTAHRGVLPLRIGCAGGARHHARLRCGLGCGGRHRP